MNNVRGNRAIVATVVLLVAAVLFPLAVVPASAAEASGEAPIRKGAILQPAESQIIRSMVPRPVPVLHVLPDGQLVEKGDVLVELDASALMAEQQEQEIHLTEAALQLEIAVETLSATKQETGAALELAREALALAKMARETFVSGEHPAQVQEAETALRLAEERRLAAEEGLRQTKASKDKTPGRLAEAQFAVAEAKAEVDAAKNHLRLLKDVLFPYRKSQLQLALTEKEMALTRAQNEMKRARLETEAAVKLTRIRFEMQRSRTELLKKHLDACEVRAPRAGRVLYTQAAPGRGLDAVPLEPGAVVRGHQPLVHLVDAKRFKLEVPLSLAVAQRLKTGRRVPVRVDAFPEQTFQGRITNMRALSQTGAVITVLVDDSKAKLRPGMSARVEFTP